MCILTVLIKYTIAGKYMKIIFFTVTYILINRLKAKTLQFTKYSIDINCSGKQQIYRFGLV